MVQKLIQYILDPQKKLPSGYYRLIISGWVVFPALYTAINHKSIWIWSTEQKFGDFSLAVVLYYLLARLGVWVWDGFNRSEKS
jgi:hypothetical protein